MDQCDYDYWFARGKEDAEKERSALFRNTRAHGIFADTEESLGWSKEEEQAFGKAYLEGFWA